MKVPLRSAVLAGNRKKLVIGYARVSSREQAINSHALDQQIARLKAAGADKVITDVKSGKKDDRSGLIKILEMIKKGEVSGVIITRIDRLGRRVPIIRKCVDTFQNCEVDFRVLDQNIALGSSGGKLMLNLLASFAEMEVDQLSERVKHGNQHRRNQRLACSCVPFAYTMQDDHYRLDHAPFLCLVAERPAHYLELYDADLEDLPGRSSAQLGRDCVEIFLQARGQRKALRHIFEKYGIQHCSVKKNGNDKIFHFSQCGFKRWLSNPVLTGDTAYLKRRALPDGRRKFLPREEWQVMPDTHPQDCLMSRDEADQIEQIIEFNASHLGTALLKRDLDKDGTYTEFAYLRELVFCAECGNKAITKTNRSKDGQTGYCYYACRHARKGCNNLKGTRKRQIEGTMIKHFLEQSQTIVVDADESDLVLPQRTKKVEDLEAELTVLEKLNRQDPALEQLKENIRQQIQDELNPFSQRALERKTAQELIQAGNNLATWNLLTADEKVHVIPKLIERITVAHGQVQSIVLKA